MSEPDVELLGRRARLWRSAVLTAVTVGVVWSSIWGNDLDWPFAPMAQFAFRVGANDSIRSTFLQARTADGDIVVVPLSSPYVGVGRAEVEAQIPRMKQDPNLLGALGTAYSRLNPGRPVLEQLWLREKVTDLHQGREAGERTDDLVTWTAAGSEPEPVPAPPAPDAPRAGR